MTLPTDPQQRKAIPIYSGFIKYFPRAICAVAELSRIGNDQHNPGKPLHWDRAKSGDEKDALMRHLIDQTIEGDNATDTDQVLHATKKAWRAMADLEKILERLTVKKREVVEWYSHDGSDSLPDGVGLLDRICFDYCDGPGGIAAAHHVPWRNVIRWTRAPTCEHHPV